MSYTPSNGDVVMASAGISILSQTSLLTGGRGVPMVGRVYDDNGPYLVAWESGETTSHVDGTGLAKVGTPSNLSLYHKFVNVPIIAGQEYGASNGLVIAIFAVSLEGGPDTDFAVVAFNGGAVATVPTSIVVVVEGNPNVN